jgi:hypothetical protein
MRARWILSTVLPITAALAIASTAVAGGTATATLDGDPPEPSAGEPVVIGFTLLQHGVTPVSWPDAFVTATNQATGERITAAATAEGAEGHYVATMTFPTDGTWEWSIRTRDLEVETRFAPITVAAPGGTRGAPQPPIIAIAGVALAGAALVASGTLLAIRSRRRVAADTDERRIAVRA